MTERSKNQRNPAPAEAAHPDAFESMGRTSAREVQANLGALVIAAALHVWGGASAATSLFDLSSFTTLVRSNVIERLEASIDIEAEEPEEPPVEEPEPEPEPEEEIPEPEPEPVAPVEAPEAPVDENFSEPEAAPAAAEAGKVLTSDPDPNEPLDLTGEGFISGTGTRFSGGVTAKDGTAKSAVRDRGARGGGVEGARGKTEGSKAVAPLAVDKSKPAKLTDQTKINLSRCGFPPEADTEQINQARVVMVAIVGPDGKPTSVNILQDPGYGFGSRLRRCAMRERYAPGMDKRGNPIASSTGPVTITFVR